MAFICLNAYFALFVGDVNLIKVGDRGKTTGFFYPRTVETVPEPL